jgi:hypothetical protein
LRSRWQFDTIFADETIAASDDTDGHPSGPHSGILKTSTFLGRDSCFIMFIWIRLEALLLWFFVDVTAFTNNDAP